MMRRHVEHALRVVGPIDFDLPIREAIGQMYERLDGSGYPNGLGGEQITPLARILGVVDTYLRSDRQETGRTEVGELSSGDALSHLAESPGRYDAQRGRRARQGRRTPTTATGSTSAAAGSRTPVAAA